MYATRFYNVPLRAGSAACRIEELARLLVGAIPDDKRNPLFGMRNGRPKQQKNEDGPQHFRAPQKG
jgi:hypothetical protein